MMKVFILLFLGCFSSIHTNEDYKQIFKSDYEDAIAFIDKNKEKISTTFLNNDIEPAFGISVLFPERIRYSIVKDFFETAALETFYVEGGSKNVDFSIGPFQIKPSFVEKLEKEIEKHPKLNAKYNHLLITGNDQSKNRKQRIQYLKSLDYQLQYASVFHEIINIKFNLSEKTNTEKLQFYAAAYNTGFDKTKKEITLKINQTYFPYGAKFKGKQYAYANVALDFYITHASKHFTN